MINTVAGIEGIGHPLPLGIVALPRGTALDTVVGLGQFPQTDSVVRMHLPLVRNFDTSLIVGS